MRLTHSLTCYFAGLRSRSFGKTLFVTMFCISALPAAAQKIYMPPEVPEELSERGITNRMRDLTEQQGGDRNMRLVSIIAYADALLDRHPESDFRVDAQILKLDALAGMAAINPAYVGRLREYIEELSCETNEERLATEIDYYGIQAFLFGARLEDMPEERQWLGLEERYRAFLDDHPDSDRRSIIMASLIRNLIRRDKLDDATHWLTRLERQYANTMTARRARGELRRATALGKPGSLTFEMQDGPPVNSAAHKGKVQIYLLWSAFTEAGIASVNPISAFYREWGNDNLYLHSINLDRDRSRADALIKAKGLPWPQSFDSRGFNAPLAIEYAILQIPTYIVIDAEGTVRYIDTGDGLEPLMVQLCNKNAAGEGKAKSESADGEATPPSP